MRLNRLGRRGFLARAAALGAAVPVAGGLLAACYDAEDPTPAATIAAGPGSATPGASETPVASGTPAPTETMDHETMTPTPTVPAIFTNDEMDAIMEARVKRFPEKTAKTGGYPKTFTMDGDVKVFEFTVDEVDWEVEAGIFKPAMGYDGVLPGPEIRVTEGDNVRLIFTNNLAESTGVHFHGIETPNNMDGVPQVTQPPIKPGETFTYEFQATPAGSHMYHSHHNATIQVGRGLLGAFIVEPKDPSSMPPFDKEYTMVLNDGFLGFTINGKSFPATEPLTAKVGETVLVRYMNEGLTYHPMHLHGFAQTVYSVDGYPLPQPYKCDTVSVAPGNRHEVYITPTRPGLWAFHCHVLSHAEAPTGMFGIVTVMIVEE